MKVETYFDLRNVINKKEWGECIKESIGAQNIEIVE